MLRVLLFFAGALASTFEDAQRLPFKGYCAKAPQAQQSGFPEAPPAHLLQEAKLQLSGIQLVFRHGARDLSSDKPCFKPMRQAFKNCSVQTLVSFTGLSPSEPLPLVREVLDAYPLREVQLPGSGYTSGLSGCGLGVLLDAAIPQTKALAAEVRRYFPRLPAMPSRNTTRLYSTGKLRTEATLFLMQRELFGDTPGVRLFSRPVTSDPWDLNQHCPRAGLARHARHYKSGPNLITRRFPDFARRWKQASGTDFQPGFKDCLLVATCSGQHTLHLPQLLQPGSPLFKEALRVSLKMYQEHYMRDPEALHLLAAPVLIELEHFMIMQATQGSPLLAMWATHDTTILVFLAALGVWDGQWPPYTDTVVLEVYKESNSTSLSNESYFRFLHHGVPVVFPWCETQEKEIRSDLIPGLCNVKAFLPPWITPYRNMQRLRDACARTAPAGLDAEFLHEDHMASQSDGFVESWWSRNSFVMYALYALSCGVFMFLGYCWRELRELNRWNSQFCFAQLETLLSS